MNQLRIVAPTVHSRVLLTEEPQNQSQHQMSNTSKAVLSNDSDDNMAMIGHGEPQAQTI